MLVPLSWLKEYLEINLSPEELAEKLLLSGTKVEDIHRHKDEVVFDLEITPNRPDELSVIGLVREIGALMGQTFCYPPSLTVAGYPVSFKKPLTVSVKDPTLCPRYAIVILDNVEVKPSPDWLAKRLEYSGMRPLNNIVDITNYLMIELGQPMHAFDYDQIAGHQMIIRASKKGEQITTLDGVKRELPPDSIVIQDRERIIDLAGLMGGQNSEISQKTKTVLLHSPIYDPIRIRRTSKALGLRTEASARFEKLLDLEAFVPAARRGMDMIQELAGGEVASDFIEEILLSPQEHLSLELTLEKVEHVLGLKISEEHVSRILNSLGFSVHPLPLANQTTLSVTPPSWRRDVEIAEDLTEEVGRIYGYNNFPLTLPSGPVPTHEDAFRPDWERKVRTVLEGVGVTEVYSHTLTSKENLEKIGLNPKNALKVNNPMSSDYEFLRSSLLPGLIQALSLNQRYFEEISLFELGRVFLPGEKAQLPPQPSKLTAVFTDKNFYQVKGIVKVLLNKLKIKEVSFKPHEEEIFSPNHAAKIQKNGQLLGSLGPLKPEILKKFDLEKEVWSFELDFETLTSLANEEIRYQPLPKYPAVEEDLALIIDREVAVENIVNSAKSVGGPLIAWISPFDIYEDPRLGEGKKSVAIRLKYQSADHTLTDNEVKEIRQKIVKELERRYQAVLRS
jgi:phenylalanyl-tRNA synthetase beta chain